MPLFKCPVCGNNHPVQRGEEGLEAGCSNSTSSPKHKTFQNMQPNDILTKNNFPLNQLSTKEDVTGRPATVFLEKDAIVKEYNISKRNY